MDLEDFCIKSIVTYSLEKEYLFLLVELEIGEFLLALFNQIKQDYLELIAMYILAYDIGREYKF